MLPLPHFKYIFTVLFTPYLARKVALRLKPNNWQKKKNIKILKPWFSRETWPRWAEATKNHSYHIQGRQQNLNI